MILTLIFLTLICLYACWIIHIELKTYKLKNNLKVNDKVRVYLGCESHIARVLSMYGDFITVEIIDLPIVKNHTLHRRDIYLV
jgi:hypothetical protein